MLGGKQARHATHWSLYMILAGVWLVGQWIRDERLHIGSMVRRGLYLYLTVTSPTVPGVTYYVSGVTLSITYLLTITARSFCFSWCDSRRRATWRLHAWHRTTSSPSSPSRWLRRRRHRRLDLQLNSIRQSAPPVSRRTSLSRPLWHLRPRWYSVPTEIRSVLQCPMSSKRHTTISRHCKLSTSAAG